jgi:RHS repeat-associated protein
MIWFAVSLQYLLFSLASHPRLGTSLRSSHGTTCKRSTLTAFRASRLWLLANVLLMAGLAGGQVNPGTPSWSAYDSHQVDTVNLQNLNVVLNVPVMSKSGAFPFRFAFQGAESYVENVGGAIVPGITVQGFQGGVNDVFGFISGSATFVNPSTSSIGQPCPAGDGSGSATKFSGWTLQIGDGTIHPLPAADTSYSGASCSSSFTDTVTDGSGYMVTITGNAAAAIYDRSGMQIVGGTASTNFAGSLVDSNGNKLTYNGQVSLTWTDTLGVTALTEKVSGCTSGSLCWNWTDVNGGSPAAYLAYSAYNLKTLYGCTGITDYGPTYDAMPTTVGFPDGTSLGVAWESSGTGDTTGRVSEISLRSGGTVQFNYNPNNAANDGLNCTYLIPNKLTRTTSDGTTTYAWAHITNGNTTTVTDQGGNKTVYTFMNGILTQVQYYQGSSTLLTTDVHCYNAASGQPGNCATAGVSLPITEVDVYHTINGLSLGSSRTQTKYDKYGNVTYSAQYDFGATTPTQTTTIVYGTSNGSGACSAIGNNVNDKPCTTVTTQSGATVGSSQFTYNPHGNLLKTYVSPNGGASFLSNATNNLYNSNGTPSITYDLANNPTTYGYNSNSYVSCGTCTQFPFPTSIANGGLTTYSTWNGIGGVKLTDTDASGNATIYGYQSSGGAADPWWRVSSVTDAISNKVWKSYTATSVNSSFTFNSSINSTTVTTDGYGRPINTQTQQGPGSPNYDTVSTSYAYSNYLRLVTTNIPCTAGLNGTCGGTNQIFTDMLGRVTWASTPATGEYVSTTYTQNDVYSVLAPPSTGENNRQVQNEYDGLGRLTKSCAIGNGSTTACGQNTGTANGVTTSTSYTSGIGYQTVSSARGLQTTRSQTVDGLGRLTSTTTPEGGTTTYIYDSVAANYCAVGAYSSPGDLVAKADANGNHTCYYYDGLHRLTDVGNNHQSTTNACKRFRYDSSANGYVSPPIGATFANTSGRLVEAETDIGTMITDEWFSYDKDGHVTDIWEKTPHSGVYYHSVATFAGNGVPLTVQLANPSLYTMTYGLEGEGRLSTIKGGTEVIVSGTTLNASGQPKYIDVGTGTDQSDYTYDPNTGRMTNWTFQVGSTSSETGTLTWNPNGTLKTLAIVDGFNAGGTQTCHFNPSDASGTGYDDLGRLVGMDCGTGGWGQTFSYDQYDNLTKNVISGRTGITWNPGYTSNNKNQYNIGSYDNAGNLLTDTFHNYVWDAYGKLSTMDSSACSTNGECITYDALGRIVETSYNGTYTEIWYTQLGKGVYMHGSAPFYAYWPGPGGSTVEANGNAASFYYMHKDWLGNARISQTIITPSVVSDQAYAPYGEVYNKLATGAGVPAQMFTGDTQDILTGIFDTPNRELVASQGRWLSPDPAGTGWNQYAYVADMPLNHIDPSGLFCIPGYCGEGGGGGDPSPPDPCFFGLFCGGGPPQPPITPPNGPGGGGPKPPNPPVLSRHPPPPTTVRQTSDCPTGMGREIDYDLLDANGNLVSTYTIVEHQTDTTRASSAFGPGTSFETSPAGANSGFQDLLNPGPYQKPGNSTQTFTVTTSQPSPTAPQQPVMIQAMDGQLYGSLGIYFKFPQVFVNGVPTPTQCVFAP